MALDTNTTTSIRIVPQSRHEIMAAGALAPERIQQPPAQHHPQHDGEVPPRKSITITRTLDIEPSSSPAPTKSASMEGMSTRGYIKGASSATQPLRAVTSFGALLPTIPKMSAIDLTRPFVASASLSQSRPSTAPGPDNHVVAPPPAPKIPPFMQSRRWARMCEVPARPRSSDHERVASDEDHPMTLREASFEQQRAIWKHAAVADKPEPIREGSTLSQEVPVKREAATSAAARPQPDDVSSIAATQGFCRPLSLPTWQIVRATRAGRKSSQSTGNVFRKLTMHRNGTTKHQRQQSIDKTPSRVSHLSHIGRKRAVSDLRKRANPPMHRRNASKTHVVDLDFDTRISARDERPLSPVPSLHDPEKAKRFSEECEEMLSNSNFEKDFITPPPSRSPTDSSKKPALSSQPQERNEKQSNAPEQQPSVRVEAPSPLLTAPEPPERSSSKNAARLATVVQMTRPACMPILNGFKDGAMVTSDDVSEHIQMQQSLVVPQPTRAPFRMVSNASTVRSADDLSKRPKAAISTDTLMLIEAQVPEQPSASLVTRLKQKTGFGVSTKKLGPSGHPPERPLPDLPAEDATLATKGVLVTLGSNSSKCTSKQSGSSPPEIERNPSNAGTDHSRVRRAPNVAAAKGLSVKAAEIDGLADSILPTPSSVYSQASSFLSEPAAKPKFVRHDKTQFRAERMKELKRQYKADLDRDRRISEEGEDETEGETRGVIKVYRDLDPPLPPLPHLREQPSLDQIDQFPPVPASRPASRASHNSGSKRAPSRTRSHVRQSSKASSRHSYRPAVPRAPNNNMSMSRQILGASQIRVLVDTNPVTGRFRAGAISPDPASSISSREGSPVKSQTPSLTGGLRSIRSGYLPLPSRIDENGDFYEHNSTPSGSPVRLRNDESPRDKTSTRSLRSHTSAGRQSATASRQSRHRTAKPQHKPRRMSFETYASVNSSPSSSPSASEDEAGIPLLPLSASTTTTALNVASPDKVKANAPPKSKRLRRRWNSNDIRTVQLLYEDLEEYYDKLMAQDRELQRQREEIRKMVRVMVPMGKARGLKTDNLVAADNGSSFSKSRDNGDVTTAPSLASAPLITSSTGAGKTAPGITASATGTPSGKQPHQHHSGSVSLPVNRGPYTHAHSHSYSSSKAQLDAAAAALDAVLRERGHGRSAGTDKAVATGTATLSTLSVKERPISNISTLSATTHSSRGSVSGSGASTSSSARLAGPASSRRCRDALDLSNGEGEGEGEPRKSKEDGSLTDPREYELDLSPILDKLEGGQQQQQQQQPSWAGVMGPVMGHVKASSTSAAAATATATATVTATESSPHRPKSRGTLSLRSLRSRTKSSSHREKGRDMTAAGGGIGGAVRGMASPIINLHRPPPIPERINREVLSEEEDGFLSAASLSGGARSTPDLLSGLTSTVGTTTADDPVGVVRKQGYLRLPGLGRSVEKLGDDNADDDDDDDVKRPSTGGAIEGQEMGLRKIRRGLGLAGLDGRDNTDAVHGGHDEGGKSFVSVSKTGLLAATKDHDDHDHDDDDDGDGDANNRLSVNHAFTRTEAWDRMLESFV